MSMISDTGGNLIPNNRFLDGLRRWDTTPYGVTLVEHGIKRFVMLNAESHSAAICSDPIDVLPGASYKVGVERALRGDCEITVIGRNSILKPDVFDEVIAEESPVRVQVTVKPGKKVGISKVVFNPVGARVRLENPRSTIAFQKPGEPFEIVVDVVNTGSEPIKGGYARLISEKHDISEESRNELPITYLDVREKQTLSWLVLRQKRAFANYEILVGHKGGEQTIQGATLRHVPHAAEKRQLNSVAGTRRWFSVGTRGIRLTAHETDHAFGAIHVGDDTGRQTFGVLHMLAQIVEHGLSPIPLWSEVSKITPARVELKGASEIANWLLFVEPAHDSSSIAIDVRLTIKRRLANASIEFGPFQTILPVLQEDDSLVIANQQSEVGLKLQGVPRQDFEIEISPQSGLMYLMTNPKNLLPGSVFRAKAMLTRVK